MSNTDIEIQEDDDEFYPVTAKDVMAAMARNKHGFRFCGVFYNTLRLMLRAGFCIVAMSGCATRDELASLKASLRTTESTVAEHTNALAAIKSQQKAIEVDSETANGQEVIQSENEPQSVPDGDESQTVKSQPDSTPAVRLFVTHAPFSCQPCDAFDRAVARGDLAGFEIVPCGDFYGLKSYPAIRWDDASSPSGKKVLYGWSDSYAGWLRKTLLPATNEFVSHALNTNPVVSHEQMVEIHNQLHGGGQWSWPGDLATHLRTNHGVPIDVDTNHRASAVLTSRVRVRTVARWPSGNWRPRNTYRVSCPPGRSS